MKASQEPAALHAALRFVVTSEIPAEHKTVLIDALTQALRLRAAADLQRKTIEEAADGPWQPHEILELESFLQGKNARSWQHADELLMHLATQLHRSRHGIRAKAAELGLGAAVDYRLASMQGSSRKEF